MTDQELYGHLRGLIQTMPDLCDRNSPQQRDAWLAKAFAIIQTFGDPQEIGLFRGAYANFALSAPLNRTHAATTVTNIVMRCCAILELRVAPSTEGTFIAVGNHFDAYTAVTRIISASVSQIMIVDPYMDDKVLLEFLQSSPPGLPILLLADDIYCKPEFKVAAQRWIAQYGASRPLEARVAPKGQLHDRLILIDSKACWVVSQSFKDIAKRSPASIIATDVETAALKVAAYNVIWNNAKKI